MSLENLIDANPRAAEKYIGNFSPDLTEREKAEDEAIRNNPHLSETEKKAMINAHKEQRNTNHKALLRMTRIPTVSMDEALKVQLL